ncbi:MAG: MFS transporter [Alphaproteobacteria bacterium]
MLNILKAVAALLLGIGIMNLGSSLLGIALPLRMEAAQYSTLITGVVMAAYFGGLLVGSIYGKRLIGAVGHIRVFAGLAAVMAAVTLIHPLLFNPLTWAILRFMSGFCVAGLFAALESWLNERSDNKTRGQVLGIYMIVNYVAIVLGQFMVNLWNLDGMEVFMVASLLVSLSLVPVVLARIEAPDLSDSKPLSLRQLHAVSPLAPIGSLVAGAVMGAFYGLGPVVARQVGFDVFEVTVFMGSVILGGLLSQWPLGRLSDRFDRRTVLLVVLMLGLLIAGGGVATQTFTDPFLPLIGIGVLLGGTMTTIYPICVAQAFDYIERDHYVAASSGLLLSYAIGSTAGPILSALVMGAMGPHGFFAYIAACMAAFAAFVLYRMFERAPLPADEQEHVVPLPRMSPVASELDPRIEPEEPTAGS